MNDISYWALPDSALTELIDYLDRIRASGTAVHNDFEELRTAINEQDEEALEPWTVPGAVLNLIQTVTFEPSVASANSGDSGPTRRPSIISAIALFLPLLLTWWTLAKAATAYGALIAAEPAQRAVPFIALWQSSFKGRLDSAFNLSSFAAKATLLILCVIVVQWWSLRKGHHHQQHAEAAQVKRQRDAGTRYKEACKLALRLERALYPHHTTTVLRFKSELTSAAKALAKLHAQAKEEREQTEVALIQLQAFLSVMQDLSQSLHDAGRSQVLELSASTKELIQSMQSEVQILSEKFSEVNHEFSASLRMLTQTLGLQLEGASSAMRQSGEQVAGQVATLATSSTSLAKDVADLNSALSSVDQRLQQGIQRALSGGAQELIDALEARSAWERSMGSRLEVVVDAFGQLIGKAGSINEQQARTLVGQVDELVNQAKLILQSIESRVGGEVHVPPKQGE